MFQNKNKREKKKNHLRKRSNQTAHVHSFIFVSLIVGPKSIFLISNKRTIKHFVTYFVELYEQFILKYLV